MSGHRDVCTFHLHDHVFGVDVTQVREVLVRQAITRVPLAPRSVVGVINLRGQIVTAIDLRTRLDLPPREEGASPAYVVVQTGDDLVAFLADRAGDVTPVDPTQFESPPDTLEGSARTLIQGAYKQPDRLLLLLDAERAAQPEAPANDGEDA